MIDVVDAAGVNLVAVQQLWVCQTAHPGPGSLRHNGCMGLPQGG
jgi:hypothetical protein